MPGVCSSVGHFSVLTLQLPVRTEVSFWLLEKVKEVRAKGKIAPGKPSGAGQPAER
jgi:hypothetical protein